MKALLAALDAGGITDVAVTAAGCPGFCEQEPLVEVQTDDGKTIRYGHVDAAAAQRIVNEHIVGGNAVADLVFA
jgi:(2Fe-2S) ferredoxin